MKKIILTSFFMIAFMTTNLIAGDCSQYKTLSHKYNMCKIGLAADGTKNMTSASSSSTTEKGEGITKGFFKKLKSKTLADMFNKD